MVISVVADAQLTLWRPILSTYVPTDRVHLPAAVLEVLLSSVVFFDVVLNVALDDIA
jgi:hypothetical protein